MPVFEIKTTPPTEGKGRSGDLPIARQFSILWFASALQKNAWRHFSGGRGETPETPGESSTAGGILFVEFSTIYLGHCAFISLSPERGGGVVLKAKLSQSFSDFGHKGQSSKIVLQYEALISNHFRIAKPVSLSVPSIFSHILFFGFELLISAKVSTFSHRGGGGGWSAALNGPVDEF